MATVTLYHYVTDKKYENIVKERSLVPSAPFNSKIPKEEWKDYAGKFPFLVARLYTCSFLESEPQSWKDYGLFELLMDEFAGGDHLLELTFSEEEKDLFLVRDHSFHSPKKYNLLPQEWRKREMRDSRPGLREAWYQSTTSLKDYDGSFICPEVLIPCPIPLDKIRVIK